MTLLVSLARETEKLDLGAHDAIELTYDELRVADGGPLLARHRHNRWMPANSPEPFARLDVQGPLILSASKPEGRVLGPYEGFCMFDGVGYVDRRVCAFTDLQQRDWYVHDVGQHWICLKIAFHQTGP